METLIHYDIKYRSRARTADLEQCRSKRLDSV